MAFEFKESYIRSVNNIFFKIPQDQVKKADFFVLCDHNKQYFLIPSIDIKENFTFKNKRKLAHIRINTAKLLSIYSTDNLDELKEHIDKLREVV